MDSKDRSRGAAPILPGLPGASPGKIFVPPPRSLRPGEDAAYCDPKTGKVVLVNIGNVDGGETRSYRGGKELGAGDRGIILAPMLKVKGDRILPNRVHPAELRSSLLLWDYMDIPYSSFLPVELSRDLQFLKDEGILSQTYVVVSGFHVPQFIASHTHVAALSAADEAEPHKWSLGRHGDAPYLSRVILEEQGGILVRLFDAIPVPDKAVPLQDILEFKAKRGSELKALQFHLERLYESIVNAPDRGRAEDRELEALDRSIADYLKVLHETPFRKILSRIDASIDLPQAWTAVGGGVAAFLQGLPLTQAVVGAGAVLSVSIGLGRKEKSGRTSPFEYVAHYHKELFF